MQNRRERFLQQINTKEAEAFKELFRVFYSTLVEFSMNYVGQQDVAEDIVQEVFVRLARVDFSKIDSPVKYLYRCVRNAALDYASTHTLRRWEELNGSELIADEVNFDLSRDDVERANRLHRLYQAIERLPEQSRRVVKLICLNNYSYADAASELGVSLATIKTHMYRSIKSLRKMMALFFF